MGPKGPALVRFLIINKKNNKEKKKVFLHQNAIYSKKSLALQVFGEVAEGLDTLTRINEAYMDEKGRPFKNIRLILLSLSIYYFVDVVTINYVSQVKYP